MMLTFSFDGEICPGIAFERDVLELSLSMTSHFDQCSKIIVNYLTSTDGVWKGENAKWFETCEDSEDVTADLTTWQFYERDPLSVILMGTMSPASDVHCYPVLAWPPFTQNTGHVDELTITMYQRLFSYLRLFGYFSRSSKFSFF